MTYLRSFALQMALLIFILAPLGSEAANLHAILVADTNDWSIGTMTKVNIDHMKTTIYTIGNNTDLNVKMTVLIGGDYNSHLLEKLHTLSFNSDDVVIFYYSGHGYRPSSKSSQWPNIFISAEGKGIDQKTITELLENKAPRFLLSMVNSCNSYADGIPEIKKHRALANPALIRNNYRKLFLETTGVIMTSSSSPGEYSWITTFGDFYTNGFISSLENQVANEEDPNWELIFARVIDKTLTDVDRLVGETQTAQFEFFPHN